MKKDAPLIWTRRQALRSLAAVPLVSVWPACASDRSSAGPCVVTPENPEGPYYRSGAAMTTDIAGTIKGTPLVIEGTIKSADCRRLGGALMDVWHCDADGQYDNNLYGDDPVEVARYRLRGRFRADGEGNYRFTTIMPGNYNPRPRHIHLKLEAEGHAPLTTQIYFSGESAVQDEGWATPELIVDLTSTRSGFSGRFDPVLRSS